jgi:hypothetical protein
MVPQLRPLRRRPAGFEFGIIGMRPEHENPKLAIGIGSHGHFERWL